MIGDAKNMIRAVLSTLGLAMVFAVISLPLLPPDAARAGTADQTPEEKKAEWQGRYRSLLQNAARLRGNVETSRENYARAQRRNYPRGGARQQFIVDAENAQKELVGVKEAIAQIAVDARHASIPPNWLYEVEDEPITVSAPASPSDQQDEQEDRAGRNPLYFDEDK